MMAGNLSSFVAKMDIDNPGNLKRSNSAPMINEINPRLSVSTTSASTSNTASRSSSPCNLFTCNTAQSRTRRFSASFSPHHTPSSSPRLTPRVSQLRQEECVDREAAHEKELHSAMVMSQSWEDLTVDPASKSEDGKSVRMLDPLHVSLPSGPPLCSSPSPTRNLSRQCFSPSMSMWKTSLSPSPTRKAFCTRSLSPIAMRPSSLGSVKRKFELDDNEPPAKRGGLLIAQSRLDVNSISPLPGSLSSVGTPESVSSADSPGSFTFRPVDTPVASPLPSPSQQPQPQPRPPPPPIPDHPMQDLTKQNAS